MIKIKILLNYSHGSVVIWCFPSKVSFSGLALKMAPNSLYIIQPEDREISVSDFKHDFTICNSGYIHGLKCSRSIWTKLKIVLNNKN